MPPNKFSELVHVTHTGQQKKAPEPQVVVHLHDLALWLLNHTNRFPKNRRVVLGDRIDHLLLDMLPTAHLAAMRRDKDLLLNNLAENLEMLRVLLRLSRELDCLAVSQFEFAARAVDQIGRQLGGWIKSRTARP
jgi:hypothetical protein